MGSPGAEGRPAIEPKHGSVGLRQSARSRSGRDQTLQGVGLRARDPPKSTLAQVGIVEPDQDGDQPTLSLTEESERRAWLLVLGEALQLRLRP